MKAETLRPLADKSAFVAAQKRGRAVQLVCSAHRRRRTTCGSAVLLGRIAATFRLRNPATFPDGNVGRPSRSFSRIGPSVGPF